MGTLWDTLLVMNNLKESVGFSADKTLALCWRFALLGDPSCTGPAQWLETP